MTKTGTFSLEIYRFFQLITLVACLLFCWQTAQATDPTAKIDFDGDNKTDIAVYRKGLLKSDPSYWFYIRSSDGVAVTTQWGLGDDYPVPGDYDNDGITDVGVFRPSGGNNYLVNRSQAGFLSTFFGVRQSYKMVRRYVGGPFITYPVQISELRLDEVSGDPKSPVYGWNYYLQLGPESLLSVGAGIYTNAPFSKMLPAPGDYNADGYSDIGVFDYVNNEFSYWVKPDFDIRYKVPLPLVRYPAPGDYNGDGKTDFAGYYIDSQDRLIWRYRESPTGSIQEFQWGTKGDQPVPGDYDGDAKTDFAVFRPSNGYWYIYQSSNGAIIQQPFGYAQDVPLNSSVIHNGF